MTLPWYKLLDSGALADLLPKEYAHFAIPVRDALAMFLEGLPAAEQAEIMRRQWQLPPAAPLAQRLGLLARSSPVLHKLGQILARDRRLSAELRKHLQELESLPPAVTLPEIEDVLRAELGTLDARGMVLEPPAIAEASVAVVIPFRQRGNPANSSRGILKVLKPRIEERLEHELRLLGRIGEYLDERCDALQIPHLDYEDAFHQVRDRLQDEVNLEHEQRHLRKARVMYSGDRRILIPKLLDGCTSRVTAMERVDGVKVTECRLGRRESRRLAGLLIQALIARPLFSRETGALFHSDPHPGNLFHTSDGRLAILDWSLVARFSEPERVALVQILLAAITLDSRRVRVLLEQLSDRSRLDRDALAVVVNRWIKRVRFGSLPGLSWMTGMLDDATQSARLRAGPDLMMFRKSLHALQGVVTDLGGGSRQLDYILCREFLRQFAGEFPERWWCLPFARDLPTRLANADLARLAASAPASVTRFWAGHLLDVIRGASQSKEEPLWLSAR